MASKLISIFLGLQCWSPVLLPCPFLHRSDSNRLESTSLQHFPFLGMKECQTWSWHVQLHLSVYVNRYQHATQKLFLYHDQNTCVWLFYVWNTTQKSRLTLPISWNFLDVKPSTFLSLCIYLGLTHSSKDTLDLILSLWTSAMCQGTEWIKLWAKSRCSEAEKRPTPAVSLFLMASVYKFGMLDTGSLY